MFALALVPFAIAAALIAAGIAVIVRHITKRDRLSVAVGGLAIPALILAGLVYWIGTMEADNPPRGIVIMANLMLVVISAPVGILTSRCAVRFLTGRKQRNNP